MQRHTRNKAFERPWRSVGLWLVSVGLGWSVVGEWDLVMAIGYRLAVSGFKSFIPSLFDGDHEPINPNFTDGSKPILKLDF